MKKKLISIIVQIFLTGILSACGQTATGSEAQESWAVAEVTQEKAEIVHENIETGVSDGIEENETTKESTESTESVEGTLQEEQSDEAVLSEEVKESVPIKEEAAEAWMERNEVPAESMAPLLTPSENRQENSASVKTSEEVSVSSSVTVPGKPSAPTEHTCDYDDGVETTKAGCLTMGVMTYTCNCGKTRTETIGATGHHIISESKAATCTESGYERAACSTCGHVESESIINATGHTEGGIEYFTCEPFCTRTAYGWYVCGVCGEHYNHQTFPALGHEPVQYNYRAGNCMQVAMWDVKCVRCEERMEFDVKGTTDPDVHDYITVTLKKWDDAIGDIVEYQVVRCSRCAKGQ